MVQTQVNLTEEQLSRLEKLASRRGVSVPELIREGVELCLQKANGMSDEERQRRGMAIVGKYKSGFHDIAVNHDKCLAEDFR